MGLMIFSFVVLCALVVLFVFMFVELAKWPGRIARQRGHRHAEAIDALAWGGLILTAGLAWLAALVWAKALPAMEGGDA
jgi:hypothetical protein